MAGAAGGIDRRRAAVGLALLPAALRAQPVEPGPFRKPDLVELSRIDRQLRFDIRYASADNVAGRALYSQPRAFLQRPAAEALRRAHDRVRREGFGLTVFDAYRPWRVTRTLWDITPPARRSYVADPARGSRHNRGCAIDLTLHRLRDSSEVEMPSEFDDFSERAHRDFTDAPAIALAHRGVLQRAMEAENFIGLANEWWHFDYADWQAYPVLDLPFEAL